MKIMKVPVHQTITGKVCTLFYQKERLSVNVLIITLSLLGFSLSALPNLFSFRGSVEVIGGT